MNIFQAICTIHNEKQQAEERQTILKEAQAFRIYVSDLLDMGRYETIHKTIQHFLDTDTEDDGDELTKWDRLLDTELLEEDNQYFQ